MDSPGSTARRLATCPTTAGRFRAAHRTAGTRALYDRALEGEPMLVRTTRLLALSLAVLAGHASAAPSNTSVWKRTNGGAGDHLGAAVATAGDFNCDGIADLAIGVPDADSLPNGTSLWHDGGWVGVWFGGATLPPQPSAA